MFFRQCTLVAHLWCPRVSDFILWEILANLCKRIRETYYFRSDRFIGALCSIVIVYLALKSGRARVTLFRLLTGPRTFVPLFRVYIEYDRVRAGDPFRISSQLSVDHDYGPFFSISLLVAFFSHAQYHARIRQTAGCIRQISHVYSYRHS